jgi:hypothetical protein
MGGLPPPASGGGGSGGLLPKAGTAVPVRRIGAACLPEPVDASAGLASALHALHLHTDSGASAAS